MWKALGESVLALAFLGLTSGDDPRVAPPAPQSEEVPEEMEEFLLSLDMLQDYGEAVEVELPEEPEPPPAEPSDK